MMTNNMPLLIGALVFVFFVVIAVGLAVEEYRKKREKNKLESRIAALEKAVAGLEKTVDTMIRLTGKQPPP